MSSDYDFVAKLYDPLLYIFLRSIRKKVMNELQDYKEQSIIDLCCGTGNQLKILAKNQFKSLHCLDLSPSMLQVAKKTPFNHIKYYHEDATKTSFENETFDIAIISFAIHEKDRETQEKFLNEAYRIIKNKGILLIVDYDYDQQTPGFVKGFINLIERIAGKEHYRNYKNFIKNNGLSSLIKEDQFKPFKKAKSSFHSITISLYKKI